jgi:hypothetical protein
VDIIQGVASGVTSALLPFFVGAAPVAIVAVLVLVMVRMIRHHMDFSRWLDGHMFTLENQSPSYREILHDSLMDFDRERYFGRSNRGPSWASEPGFRWASWNL